MKDNVLIIFGGASTEHDISCVSASFIAENINKDEHELTTVGITLSGAWFLYKGSYVKMADGSWERDSENLFPAVLSPCPVHHGLLVLNKAESKYSVLRVDCAMPVLHGRNGEDGTIQGLLTLAGIPFTGCDTYSSAVTMDKAATKIICEREGIRTSPFIVARASDDIASVVLKSEQSFGYPVFVKPVNSGSSVGITKATDRASLEAGIATAFRNDRKIVIEKAMRGMEIEVAVIGNDKPEASVCGHIDPNADFYDYDTKYVNDTAIITIPAELDKRVADAVRDAAVKAYSCLDCSGMSRVDFFVDGDDIILNEINTIPGFTSISMYPKLMNYGGRAPSALIDELIGLAYGRMA